MVKNLEAADSLSIAVTNPPRSRVSLPDPALFTKWVLLPDFQVPVANSIITNPPLSGPVAKLSTTPDGAAVGK